MSGGRPKVTHLGSKEFAHEHGVPVDAVIRTIVHPHNVSADLYAVLSAMSCRALLLKEQVAAVDGGFKSSLAGNVKMAWGSYPAGSLPLRYLALARYHAASPALLDELVPNSRRAAILLAEFRALVKDSASEAITCVERMMLDHRAAPVAYIPDYTFDWARV